MTTENKINIFDHAEKIGIKIAEDILQKFSDYPYLLSTFPKNSIGFFSDLKRGFFTIRETRKMEVEIWGKALQEAAIFFLENREMKSDAKIRASLLDVLIQISTKPAILKKRTPEELFAMQIRGHTTDHLLENNVLVFENATRRLN